MQSPRLLNNRQMLSRAMVSFSNGSCNLLLLCIAKTIRTMGFGAISIVLALFLLNRGFSSTEVGLLLSATLLEDALITTLAASVANRIGVRKVLFIACAVIVCGGIVLATAEEKWILILAVTCGIVSPAGYEGGPFAPLEQTIISNSTKTQKLTAAYSWYNMVGFAGAALGALLAGICVAAMKFAPPVVAYQTIFYSYSIGGLVLGLIYALVNLKPDKAPLQAEEENIQQTAGQTQVEEQRRSVSSKISSRKRIWQLAGLQSVDAFGGGFVVQSLLTLWFYQRYHVDATFIGPVYFWCNIIAALSFVFAPLVVRRVGLLNTMVFTHLPCSLALCLMPFLPSAAWAAGLLLLRSGFSSMDIPVRQAYTMLIVPEKDRAFAAGLTTSSRAIAQGIAPTITGALMQNVMSGAPLIVAGALKSIYDVSLYFCFKHVPIHSEHAESERANRESNSSAGPRETGDKAVKIGR
ncbi:MFS transporter [Candidatus Obscuribacterales bacterium]|nr:MFS transporter [Candidatus Obscuribacterales bacterium]